MFCHKCGAEIPNDSLFCPKCGAKLASIVEKTETRDLADTLDADQRRSDGAEHAQTDESAQSDRKDNAEVIEFLSSLVNEVPDQPSNEDAAGDGGDEPRSGADMQEGDSPHRSQGKFREMPGKPFMSDGGSPSSSKSTVRKMVIAALIVVVVIVGAVFIVKPAYERFRDQSEQQKAQQQAEEAEAEFAREHPVLNGILSNCRSTQTVSISLSDDKNYVVIQLADLGDSAMAETSASLDCVREQVGIEAKYDAAYLNGADVYMKLSSAAVDELMRKNYDINAAKFHTLGDKAIVRCVDSSGSSAYCEIGESNDSSSDSSEASGSADSGQNDSSSASNVDHGTPDDAVGYDKYKDYNCVAGNSGKLAPCSEIYEQMGKYMNYLPFGRENNPDLSDSFGYIAVDENGNGMIDADE